MQAAQHKNLRLRERLSLSVIRSAMLSAQNLADQAAQYGDVPVGAVVLSPQGQVIGKGYNQVYHHHDVGAHAEMIALRQACQALKSSRRA